MYNQLYIPVQNKWSLCQYLCTCIQYVYMYRDREKECAQITKTWFWKACMLS